jgi:hypothetical protein
MREKKVSVLKAVAVFEQGASLKRMENSADFP